MYTQILKRLIYSTPSLTSLYVRLPIFLHRQFPQKLHVAPYTALHNPAFISMLIRRGIKDKTIGGREPILRVRAVFGAGAAELYADVFNWEFALVG